MGFDDIEYGMENPRFTAHVPDTTSPGAKEAQEYYERVWQVFHLWCRSGRSLRDCRVAELFAMQQGNIGTVRGIARQLKIQKLRPWSTKRVQKTLHEIHLQACKQNPTDSESYFVSCDAAA